MCVLGGGEGGRIFFLFLVAALKAVGTELLLTMAVSVECVGEGSRLSAHGRSTKCCYVFHFPPARVHCLVAEPWPTISRVWEAEQMESFEV